MRSLLADGVSAWTGGVEGMKDGKKKDRSDRSVWRGERCVGRFSQLPTLLWILRFKGLVFFLRALRTRGQGKTGNENHTFHQQFNQTSWKRGFVWLTQCAASRGVSLSGHLMCQSNANDLQRTKWSSLSFCHSHFEGQHQWAANTAVQQQVEGWTIKDGKVLPSFFIPFHKDELRISVTADMFMESHDYSVTETTISIELQLNPPQHKNLAVMQLKVIMSPLFTHYHLWA